MKQGNISDRSFITGRGGNKTGVGQVMFYAKENGGEGLLPSRSEQHEVLLFGGI